jgi:Cys-tRNA(Pro)/Cys-tRNA(Cys) deacylase
MSMTTEATKPVKTNAARLLDSLGIAYEVRTYQVDPDDLSAISVARKIDMPTEQVFKTLLTRAIPTPGQRETPHFFAVIPGDAELDLKKLAHAASVKKIELASLRDVEPLTGYVRGGVTVMAARTAFPAYVDETIELHEAVSVSAGQRGTQLVLSPADYLRATGATLSDLTKATHHADSAVEGE